jgi:type II secretory pathway component PulK
MQKKRAQVLIISLWVLVALSIFAVSIGQRVATALKISRQQINSLKAYYLARAYLNFIIRQIDTHYNACLGSFDPELLVQDNQDSAWRIIDQESKVNINTASQELLIGVLEEYDVGSAQEIARNIMIWRGDILDDNKIYEELGYPCKGERFSNVEELMLVKGISPQDYARLKEAVTVYGKGLININTVSPQMLGIFTRAIAKKLAVSQDYAGSITDKVIISRNNHNGCFQDKDEIDISITGDEEANIFNELLSRVVTHSDNFLIEVEGNDSRIESRITAIYDRFAKKIIAWYEE